MFWPFLEQIRIIWNRIPKVTDAKNRLMTEHIHHNTLFSFQFFLDHCISNRDFMFSVLTFVFLKLISLFYSEDVVMR